MEIPKTVNELLQSVGLQSWVLQVFIIVFLTLVLVFVLKRVLNSTTTVHVPDGIAGLLQDAQGPRPPLPASEL